MNELSLEDIEFIKILANSDSTILQAGMNEVTRCRLDAQIGVILREYYKENTMNTKTEWIKKFEKVGITEDIGKAAIACARRLGIDIS
ncbi:MAG: hypothetical protein EPO37_02625 [Nitrosarchaeum sp.]|nr:MAG: hypothetical protein EPO37_02625 [Nitrosarchaeum sp.]